jgi:hypothetical protein
VGTEQTNADFERFLDSQLQTRLGELAGPTTDHRRAAYHLAATGSASWFGVAGARRMPASRAAVALVTAALALVAGSAVAAAAVTGSSDPGVWGRTVTQAVAECKDHLADGEHGIGQCVSEVARRHGEAQKEAHGNGGSDNQDTGDANGDHPGQGGDSNGPHGKPAGVPSPNPAASDHPAPGGATGNPPGGPPATPPGQLNRPVKPSPGPRQ